MESTVTVNQTAKHTFFTRTFVVILVIQCCYNIAATFIATPIDARESALGPA